MNRRVWRTGSFGLLAASLATEGQTPAKEALGLAIPPAVLARADQSIE